MGKRLLTMCQVCNFACLFRASLQREMTDVRGHVAGTWCSEMLQRNVAATKRCVVHTEATCIRVAV